MYSVKFDTFIPGLETKLTVIASCKAIVGYDVINLQLKFLDDDNEVIRIKYDKEFFEDLEQEANEALLEEYYHPGLYGVN